MNLTEAQRAALRHLRGAYVGPDAGEEEVISNRPQRQYAVGMLFPAPPDEREPEVEEEFTSDVLEGDVEEDGGAVPLAEDWRPSSTAISFVLDGESVAARLRCGTYEPVA